MTGFNLPPGTTYAMLDEAVGTDAHCEVCKQYADNCICPECPTCSAYGDPRCYKDHNLVLSNAQLAAQTRAAIADLKDQIADHEYYLQWLEEQQHAEEYRKLCEDMSNDPDDLGDRDWEQRYDKHYPDKA